MENAKDIKVLLVETEEYVASPIILQLKDLGYSEIIRAFSIHDAISTCESENIDVALINTKLGGALKGIDLGVMLKKMRIPTLFFTARKDEETFEKAKLALPYAYLVLPIEKEVLKRNIEISLLHAAKTNPKIRKKISLETKSLFEDELFLKSGQQVDKVNISEILWVHSEGNYCVFQTAQRKYAMKISLKKILERFEPHGFIRVHQRYVVNIDRVSSVDLTKNTVLINEESLPIGRKFKPIISARFTTI
jgi:DNA-binding LytR/AlgR family response regulator